MMPMDPLVSTDWLAARLEDADLAVLDATWFMPGRRATPARNTRSHIPGAVFFDIDEVCDHARGLPHMLAPPADFAVAARRLGVNQGSLVVVYDAQGLFSAPRVWWNFRAMGTPAPSSSTAGWSNGAPKAGRSRAAGASRCMAISSPAPTPRWSAT